MSSTEQPILEYPVAEGQQHDAVRHQGEIDERHQAVGLEEAAIRKALDQRDRRQRDEGVEGPFADALGQPALFLDIWTTTRSLSPLQSKLFPVLWILVPVLMVLATYRALKEREVSP